MTGQAAEQKPRVQTAARTVNLLTEVAVSGPAGISAKRLSENLGLPRQVVYHLIHTLLGIGAVRKVGSSNIVLGLSMAPIAEGFRIQLGSGDLLMRYASMAAKATGETAYVVGWVDNKIVVLASARGSSAIAAAEIPQGTTGDAHARASGKLLLSAVPKETVDEYIARNPLTPRTHNTITTRDAFDAELAIIREQGLSFDREEYTLGLSCMAVPLGSRQLPRLALGISAPTARFHDNVGHYKDLLLSISTIAPED